MPVWNDKDSHKDREMNTTVASATYLMKLKSRQEVAEQTMAFRFEKPASLSFIRWC